MNLKNLFSKKQEKRSLNYVSNFSNALTYSTLYNNYNSLNLSCVYRAVEIISDSLSMLPIKIMISNNSQKSELENHVILQVLNNKNNILSKNQLIKNLANDLLLKGNAFAYIEKANDGTVLNINYCDASDVQIYYNKFKNELYYMCTTISNNRIEKENMIHLYKNNKDLKGISILNYANRSINIAQNTENQANNYFANGCNLGGILSFDVPLTYQQKLEAKQSWNQNFSGNEGGVAVLDAKAHFQQLQQNSKDSQMLESRVFNVYDISRYFGISPVLLGDLSHSSYNSLEDSQLQFLTQTLQPYISMFEAEFNKKLLKENESNLSINFDETYILKSNKTQLSSYYTQLLEKGILSINEVRKELGYNQIQGGDVHNIYYNNNNNTSINNNNSSNSKEENDILK